MAVAVGPRPLPRVLLSSDLGANAVREAHRAGLTPVRRGAFVEPLDGASERAEAEHLAAAAVAAVGRRLTNGAVFTHESAALLHGLWLLHAPDLVHVTQQSRPRRQAAGLRRHTGAVQADVLTEVNGLRASNVERTLVDCAKSMHPRDALVVADSGMRLLLQPHRRRRDDVEQRAEELRLRLRAMVESGARHGRRQARAVIAHADPFSESPYESVIRWVAVSRGLPGPVLQARFRIRGNTYYVDLCWLFELTVDGRPFRLLLLVEYDGERKYGADGAAGAAATAHAAAQRVIAEKRREDDLRSMPDTVMVRFDRRDAYRDEQTFRRLCERLPAAYATGLRPVPELLGCAAPRARRRPAGAG